MTCMICQHSKRRLFVDRDLRAGLEPRIIATRRHFSASAITAHAAHMHGAQRLAAESNGEQAPLASRDMGLTLATESPYRQFTRALRSLGDAYDQAADDERLQAQMRERLMIMVRTLLQEEDI